MFDLSFAGIVLDDTCVPGCAPAIPLVTEWELPEWSDDHEGWFSRCKGGYLFVSEDGEMEVIIKGCRFIDIWW